MTKTIINYECGCIMSLYYYDSNIDRDFNVEYKKICKQHRTPALKEYIDQLESGHRHIINELKEMLEEE